MAEHPRTITAETLRRMARELTNLPLSQKDEEALLPLLNAIFAEVQAIEPFERDGVEPIPRFVAERWSA
jgi:hypothetical protein